MTGGSTGLIFWRVNNREKKPIVYETDFYEVSISPFNILGRNSERNSIRR